MTIATIENINHPNPKPAYNAEPWMTQQALRAIQRLPDRAVERNGELVYNPFHAVPEN